MSCDLSDPRISEAYDEIVNGQDTNWLILGYNDTRDKISLYSKGSGGLDELRNSLREEVLYGFLRIEDRYILITYVSEQVSGVRRARALVHGRAVGGLFKKHEIQINASTPNDLTEANVRNRLKLGDPADSLSTQKRLNSTPPTLSPTSQSPTSPRSPSQEAELAEAAARQESERRAQEDAERQSRDAADRRKAEQVAREAAQRRALEEAERKKNEALEQERREKAATEAKIRAETERKNREEAERKRTEELRSKFAELEKSGKVTLSGYITVQGGGVYFWKRRFFELRGKTLYLFRDENEKVPISKLELDGQVTGVTDAQSEVLILNSFKVDFRSSEPYYFFSDDKKDKESFVAAIGRYVSTK